MTASINDCTYYSDSVNYDILSVEEELEFLNKKEKRNKRSLRDILQEKNTMLKAEKKKQEPFTHTKIDLPKPNVAVSLCSYDASAYQEDIEKLSAYQKYHEKTQAYVDEILNLVLSLPTKKSKAQTESENEDDDFISFSLLSLEGFEVEMTKIFHNYQKEFLQSKTMEFSLLKEQNKQQMMLNQKLFAELQEKYNVEKSSEKVAMYMGVLTSVSTIFLGIVMASTGAIGAFACAVMITSGVLAGAQQVTNAYHANLKHHIDVNLLDKTLTGLQILTLVLSIGIAIGPAFAKEGVGLLDKGAQVVNQGYARVILDSVKSGLARFAALNTPQGGMPHYKLAAYSNALNSLFSGMNQVTQGVAGYFSAQAKSNEAKTADLAAEIQLTRAQIERLRKVFSDMNQDINQVLKIMVEIINNNARSAQEVARTVARSAV